MLFDTSIWTGEQCRVEDLHGQISVYSLQSTKQNVRRRYCKVKKKIF